MQLYILEMQFKYVSCFFYQWELVLQIVFSLMVSIHFKLLHFLHFLPKSSLPPS